VALADLNGDGAPDMAVPNATSDDLSVLMNRGDGTFDPEVRYAAGDLPRMVVLTDLNSDGHADMVTPNAESDDMSVFINRGDGTFDTQRRFPAGESPSSLAVNNLDADGDADLAVTNITRSSRACCSIAATRPCRASRRIPRARRSSTPARGRSCRSRSTWARRPSSTSGGATAWR
jgi:hypothetical protein